MVHRMGEVSPLFQVKLRASVFLSVFTPFLPKKFRNMHRKRARAPPRAGGPDRPRAAGRAHAFGAYCQINKF